MLHLSQSALDRIADARGHRIRALATVIPAGGPTTSRTITLQQAPSPKRHNRRH